MRIAFRSVLTCTLLSLLLLGCVDPSVPAYDYQTGFVLVEGSIVDRPGESEVRISRSELAFGIYKLTPLTDATVFSISGSGEEVPWQYSSDRSAYRPDTSFRTRVDETYAIRVLLPDGALIESSPEAMSAPVPLESLRMIYDREAYFSSGRDRFVPAFTLLANFRDPAGTDNFYRYTHRSYSRTIVCKTCYGGVYRGGDDCISAPRVDYYDYLCDRECWSINRGESFELATDEFNPGGTFTDLPTARIDYTGSGALLAEVDQYAITRPAHRYYKTLQDLRDNSAGLNAPLPAALYGNLSDLSDERSVVLGYVSVAAVSTQRLFWNRDTIPGDPVFLRPPIRLEDIMPSPPTAPCSGPNFTSVKPVGWQN